MSDYISHDHEHDGIDRRGFLKCMAWAGTGVAILAKTPRSGVCLKRGVPDREIPSVAMFSVGRVRLAGQRSN